MTECNENQDVLDAVHAAIKESDSEVIVPMMATIMAGAAAQSGVNKDYLMRYVREVIDDAYAFFTRDKGESVH